MLLLLLLLVELPALLLLLPVGLGLLMTPPPGLILEATYRRPIALLSPLLLLGPRGTGLVTKALAEAAPKRTTAAATHKPVNNPRPSDAPMPLRLLLLLLAPIRPIAPS